MAIGGAALILLGVRRYGLRRAPLLDPPSRLLVGLISLRERFVPEALEVLSRLRADGIRRIVMLTGDHPIRPQGDQDHRDPGR
ncbi:hypothetical protein AZG88_36185 [Rhodococcus sp. LB1]|nr:hypothetical protein [Rhodococcus sp. LB1]KXX60741.1 hypothetical protein AZG88_36185 [Rhodococcus sp. LB1]